MEILISSANSVYISYIAIQFFLSFFILYYFQVFGQIHFMKYTKSDNKNIIKIFYIFLLAYKFFSINYRF